MSQRALKIGLPKGSLQEATFELMRQAGFEVSSGSRSYFPTIDDPELEAVLFRAQETSRYVEDGVIDAGITGQDWISENGSDVVEVAELVYAKRRMVLVRWVLAVPAESAVQKPQDLQGCLIATELVRTTRQWFDQRGIDVKVEFSWGATEAKARLVDAIVDVTETGSSLRAQNLRVVDTIMTSSTKLIANKHAWQDPWKRDKIESIALNLEGAIRARDKVGLKLNVREDRLEAVLKLLPAMKNPTINRLSEEGWFAVETVLDEKTERELVPQIKRAGGEGLIVYPLRKVIP